MFGKQTLLWVPGCSVQSAASVAGEFDSIAKPVVGLVGVVGRSLRVGKHVVLELEACLVLQPAFGSMLG